MNFLSIQTQKHTYTHMYVNEDSKNTFGELQEEGQRIFLATKNQYLILFFSQNSTFLGKKSINLQNEISFEGVY